MHFSCFLELWVCDKQFCPLGNILIRCTQNLAFQFVTLEIHVNGEEREEKDKDGERGAGEGGRISGRSSKKRKRKQETWQNSNMRN